MTTETAEKWKVITVEKGIRQIGPKRWEVRVHAGRHPGTGAIRQISRTTTGGIREARSIRAKLLTEVAEGDHGNAAGTFGALLDAWLKDGKRGRAETTINGYRVNIESAIRPALGNVPLDELTTEDLDKFYGKLMDEGVSPATIMHHHRVISAALRQGEKWKKVPTSVARDASPPRVPRKAMTIPPPERVRELISEATTARSRDLATIVTVAALTGMRRGELCGLRWCDIDWEGSTLTVRHALWQTGSKWGLKDPKTHQVRKVSLGMFTLAALSEHWREASRNAVEAEVALEDESYVFTTLPDGSRPLMPDTLSRQFRALCERIEAAQEKSAVELGVRYPDEERWPYRLHDLRHYTATELLRAGHNPRTVADRLGHADPAMTLRVYAHDTDDQAVAAGSALEAGIVGRSTLVAG